MPFPGSVRRIRKRPFRAVAAHRSTWCRPISRVSSACVSSSPDVIVFRSPREVPRKTSWPARGRSTPSSRLRPPCLSHSRSVIAAFARHRVQSFARARFAVRRRMFALGAGKLLPSRCVTVTVGPSCAAMSESPSFATVHAAANNASSATVMRLARSAAATRSRRQRVRHRALASWNANAESCSVSTARRLAFVVRHRWMDLTASRRAHLAVVMRCAARGISRLHAAMSMRFGWIVALGDFPALDQTEERPRALARAQRWLFPARAIPLRRRRAIAAPCSGVHGESVAMSPASQSGFHAALSTTRARAVFPDAINGV